MSERDDDDLFKGPTLDANGRLENRFAKVETPAPAEEAPLELAERGPKKFEARIEQFREAPRRSRLPLFILVLALLGAFGTLALFLVKKPSLPQLVAVDPQPILITSEPPGAKIVIDGTEVGVTPWAGENRWVGEPKVVLQLKGFRAWEGKLTGGKRETIDARLKK